MHQLCWPDIPGLAVKYKVIERIESPRRKQLRRLCSSSMYSLFSIAAMPQTKKGKTFTTTQYLIQ